MTGEVLDLMDADPSLSRALAGAPEYSAAEVVVKEVEEETGIIAEPVRLIAVLDGLRLGFTRVPLYSLLFHCSAVGGELSPHPLETSDVGWFTRETLPCAGYSTEGHLMTIIGFDAYCGLRCCNCCRACADTFSWLIVSPLAKNLLYQCGYTTAYVPAETPPPPVRPGIR